jgi:5'-nucleotidase
MDNRPLILLTNDDGVRATGLCALREALLDVARTVVVAPAEEQSACSHAVTLKRPLRCTQHDEDVYSLDGTPADCVYLALFGDRFLPRRPDLVLSGINHGANLGTDVFYSGTVAGAREAAIRGIAAMALSYQDAHGLDAFGRVAATAREMALGLLDALESPDRGVLLNVNFPRRGGTSAVATHLARRVYEDRVVARRDPYDREYFWLGGRPIEQEPSEGSDLDAVNRGCISITPLALEAVNTSQMAVAVRLAQRCTAERAAAAVK